jgi:DNA helicase-2/ATP-dependent DNA helicase PcrA
MKCLENLNVEQRRAVGSFEKNSIVFAGPGTGKTCVITSRIAYMFEAGILQDSKKYLLLL